MNLYEGLITHRTAYRCLFIGHEESLLAAEQGWLIESL